MPRADAQREAAVRPRVVEAIATITAAAIVSDPVATVEALIPAIALPLSLVSPLCLLTDGRGAMLWDGLALLPSVLPVVTMIAVPILTSVSRGAGRQGRGERASGDQSWSSPACAVELIHESLLSCWGAAMTGTKIHTSARRRSAGMREGFYGKVRRECLPTPDALR
jgi:hypothetical protein